MNVELGGVDLLLREPDGAPEGALILNHGRGTDERDLFPLLDALDPERRLLGVSSGAPIQGLPPGGRHWYVVERVGYPHADTFQRTYPQLTQRLDDLLEQRAIAWSDTIIGGFSQGAVMSYAVSLGRGRPTAAGLLAFSGFIPEVTGWEAELAGREGLRAVIHHGANDPVIGVEFGRDAAARLRSQEIELNYLETAAGHSLPAEAIDAGQSLVATIGTRSGERC